MHESVHAKWHDFSTPLEGRVHSPYLDVKGLVTVGVGNLIDPVSEALKLPWKLPDGSLASKETVRADWQTLKDRPDLAKLHWKYAAKLTTIRLTDEDIDALVDRRLRENETYLRATFHDWDRFPADAQLGILSMAWAVGAGFTQKFTNFTRAALKQDWVGAAVSCKIRTTKNPGVVPRNRHNELCFHNAATVLEQGLPIDVLHWPNKVEPQKSTPENPRPWLTDGERERVRLAQVDDIAINRADFMRDLSGLESIPPGTDDEGGLDA